MEFNTTSLRKNSQLFLSSSIWFRECGSSSCFHSLQNVQVSLPFLPGLHVSGLLNGKWVISLGFLIYFSRRSRPHLRMAHLLEILPLELSNKKNLLSPAVGLLVPFISLLFLISFSLLSALSLGSLIHLREEITSSSSMHRRLRA